jgi:hypothetical protein
MGVCQPALAWTGLAIRSDWSQWAHSASCAAAMLWISASWSYNLSTPSVEGGDGMLRGEAIVVLVCPPLRLMEGAAPLA